MIKEIRYFSVGAVFIVAAFLVAYGVEPGQDSQRGEKSLAHSVSCGDDLDAVRILSNEFSVPYGVLRLQAAIAAPRSNAEAGHRVYAEAGQTIDGALQMLNAETSEYNVRTIDGIFVATETAIKDSENPLLVTVRDFEYNGTLDGLLHRLTKGVLDMGPPMYAFSNGDGQQLLELPLSINTEGQRSVAEILAEASRISGVNWHLTVMPNAKELVVDQASNEIRAASKRRLMVMLSRSSR